jgi:pimeloyl-ACP methyl ester carboxylesterase
MESTIEWQWQGQQLRLGTTRLGKGPQVLLLPALSSISTRKEMQPLQEQIASSFSTLSVDWPGFGDLPRPSVAWEAGAYRAFLRHLLVKVCPQPYATIAAGHAAGFLLGQAAAAPASAGRLILVAPTWRGPLPTMIGRRLEVLGMIAKTGDWPVIGQILYRLNVNKATVGMMARGHVYEDRTWLSENRLNEKLAVIQSSGARHASLRFVTGELDPMTSREEFLHRACRIKEQFLVVYGARTPPKSKIEMESLRPVESAKLIMLPLGKLAIHEEHPVPVAQEIIAFLRTPV